MLIAFHAHQQDDSRQGGYQNDQVLAKGGRKPQKTF